MASGRSDSDILTWWNAILADGSKFEDFADTGDPRYATVDIKLTSSLTACVREGNKALASKIASLEDEAVSKAQILKGRQIGWLIHHWFRLNPDMKQLYSLQDNSNHTWMGDDKIFEFLELWKQIVANNAVKLDDQQLATVLVQKLPQGSKAIGQDVAYWHRLPECDPQKTYYDLISSMESYLDRV